MFIFTKSDLNSYWMILHVKGITNLFKEQQVLKDKILVYA